MRLAPLLLVLLASCVQSLPVGAERPPRESDLVAVDSVIGAWRAARQPYTSRCEAERASRFVIVRSDDVGGYCASRGPCCGSAERQHACGCAWDQGRMGCAAGATTYEADIVQPFAGLTDTWRVMVWLSPYEDEQTQRRVVAHEAVHWLGTCALGDVDRLHRRAGWWGADGYESAAW
jgi:hypothetical protein